MADVIVASTDSTYLGTAADPVTLNNQEWRLAQSAAFAGDGSAIGARGGIVRHGDSSLSVTVDASDVVTVQPGAVVLAGDPVQRGAGCYLTGLPVASTGTLNGRDVTNARIDLVVYRQLDPTVLTSSTLRKAQVAVIAGTPSATPSAPALPSMAVELARVTVPASGGGSASVDSSYRTYATAIGGEIIVPTSARLPASAAKYQRARALDTGRQFAWSGSAWVGNPVVCSIVRNANQSIPNNTYTLVSFDGDINDPDNIGGSSGITVPVSGYYHVSGMTGFNGPNSGVRLGTQVSVSGTYAIDTLVAAPNAGATAVTTSGLVYATSGQVIELRTLQASGATVNMTAARLFAHLVTPA